MSSNNNNNNNNENQSVLSHNEKNVFVIRKSQRIIKRIISKKKKSAASAGAAALKKGHDDADDDDDSISTSPKRKQRKRKRSKSPAQRANTVKKPSPVKRTNTVKKTVLKVKAKQNKSPTKPKTSSSIDATTAAAATATATATTAAAATTTEAQGSVAASATITAATIPRKMNVMDMVKRECEMYNHCASTIITQFQQEKIKMTNAFQQERKMLISTFQQERKELLSSVKQEQILCQNAELEYAKVKQDNAELNTIAEEKDAKIRLKDIQIESLSRNIEKMKCYKDQAMNLNETLFNLETEHGNIDNNDENEILWKKRWIQLKHYKEINGNFNIPSKEKENRDLINWINKQRMNYKLFNKSEPTDMKQVHIDLLNGINFEWIDPMKKPSKPLDWEIRFQQLKQFKNKFGHFNVSSCETEKSYVVEKGLSCWVNEQRRMYKKQQQKQNESSSNGTPTRIVNPKFITNTMVPPASVRIQKLESIGFIWNPRKL